LKDEFFQVLSQQFPFDSHFCFLFTINCERWW